MGFNAEWCSSLLKCRQAIRCCVWYYLGKPPNDRPNLKMICSHSLQSSGFISVFLVKCFIEVYWCICTFKLFTVNNKQKKPSSFPAAGASTQQQKPEWTEEDSGWQPWPTKRADVFSEDRAWNLLGKEEQPIRARLCLQGATTTKLKTAFAPLNFPLQHKTCQ